MVHVVVVAACVGAVVLAGSYIVFGSDHLFRRKARCPGLINLGNTCFLNAILQALASLTAVRRWLLKSVEKHNGPLTKALHEVLTVLCTDGTSVYSPDSVLRALSRHRWKLTFEQQDAHELYHIFLSTLEEEMSPSAVPSLNMKLLSDDLQRGSALTQAGRVPAPHKQFCSPLRGTMRSILQCCVCKKKLPTRYEYFHSLSLIPPVNVKECSLESCLQRFMQFEVVDNVDCPSCSKMTGIPIKRKFYKQLHLGAIPNTLCLHINRTMWQSTLGLNKNMVHMSFPFTLNMGCYMDDTDHPARTRQLYSLQSVIEHTGGPLSGHYTTYRKVKLGKRSQWVLLSDTSVYDTTVKDVLEATAFMLFYEKID